MLGDDNDPGIMTMAVRELFQGIDECSNREFIIRLDLNYISATA